MVKRQISASTRARLKAQRKKAGIGEFSKKAKKSRTRRTSTRPRAGKRVRRASIRRRSAKVVKRRRSTRRATGFGANLQKPLMAGLVFAFVQPFVSIFLRRFGFQIQDEIITIFGAVLIRMFFKGPLIRVWSDAAITIATAQLVQDQVSRLFPAVNA